MMLKKPTLIKIAVALAVVIALVVALKFSTGSKREVIVTAMPMNEFVPAGYKDDDDAFEVVTTAPVKEGYAEYEQEGFEEYSSADYKTDLLE